MRFQPLITGQRKVENVPRVQFPFRASAMRLPIDWHDLDWDQLQRHALALGFGLKGEQLIREIHAFVRQTIIWSAQRTMRSSLDIFCTGIGACGATNAYAGLLLELNGVRFRGVSGFDPQVRIETGGFGGHSVGEVFDLETGRWSYIDPYLDLYLPGISAADLASNEVGKMMIGAWTRLRPLSGQFRYRRYYDRLNRMASPTMLQCDQSTWGVQWPLLKAPKVKPADLFPEAITIHVRARYILTNGQTVLHRSVKPEPCSLRGIRASRWATTSFTVRPHELLGL